MELSCSPCPEESSDSGSHSHRQCTPQRDAHCAYGNWRTTCARSQPTQEREEHQ
jgi:hypothetical protein